MATRRTCLKLFGASAAQMAARAQSSTKASTKLGMPGLFRGRVAAIENPASIISGNFQSDAIQTMLRRGMMELTGAPAWQDAWKMFFKPGDVVGIKLNPVGMPHVMSSAPVVNGVIEGLRAAGLKPQDIVVYDRYRAQFFKAGYDKWLPERVRMSHAAEDYDDIQQAIEGYDPDVYLDLPLTRPGFDISNKTARQSHASLFISKQVNKLVNLPVLKDHQSAGVTLALKNMSHGLVNNVSRSHGTVTANACGTFTPAVVSMPVIRDKAVLHILDGIKGLYHGGPSARPQFVWEHHTLYFATDPVALDRIGWKAIDAQRASVGMKPVAEDKPDEFSHFLVRQPEHIELAGSMGLGEFDENKIVVKRVKL